MYRSLHMLVLAVVFTSILPAQPYPSSSSKGPGHFVLARSDSGMQPALDSPKGTRSPLLATTMSAVIPGAGQIYTERYWTIPLIWGFGYWFVRQYRYADGKYDEWREAYSRSLAQGPFAGVGDPQAKYIRDFYRDERDRFAFYLAITYVLNLVDAYVSASLYNFDVSEDLTGGAQLRLTMRIPIR